MAWDITGNNGTNPNNNNFLGTIDNEPLVIRTNNTERLRVDANGNVGIGTGHPNKALSVNAAIETAYEGTYFGGMFGVGGNDYYYGVGARESDSLVYDTFQYHRWPVGTNEKMTLDGSGNLGIGVNNPGMALDVQGRTRLRDGIGGPARGTAGVWFNTANQFGAGGIADIGFNGVVDATRIGFYGNDPRGGSHWGFTFDTATGNVVIGFPGGLDPTAKLSVNGDISANGNILAQGVGFPNGSFQTTANLRGAPGNDGRPGPPGPKGDKGDKGNKGNPGVRTTTSAVCGPSPCNFVCGS